MEGMTATPFRILKMGRKKKKLHIPCRLQSGDESYWLRNPLGLRSPKWGEVKKAA